MIQYAESTGYESGAYNVHHVYRDNGESGLTLDRPAMNTLMADIRAGRVERLSSKTFHAYPAISFKPRSGFAF